MRPLGNPLAQVAGLGRLWQPLAYAEGACSGRQMAVSVDGWWGGDMGACRVRMRAGVRMVSVVLVRVVVVLSAVDGCVVECRRQFGRAPCRAS